MCCVGVFAQSKGDLQKWVETELSFVKTAAEKGAKAAFIEFAAPDGIMFNPNAPNAGELWKNLEAKK